MRVILLKLCFSAKYIKINFKNEEELNNITKIFDLEEDIIEIGINYEILITRDNNLILEEFKKNSNIVHLIYIFRSIISLKLLENY